MPSKNMDFVWRKGKSADSKQQNDCIWFSFLKDGFEDKL